MNDEAFSRLVAEEVKNKASDSGKKYLAMPENLERWKRALDYLSKNLEQQIVDIDHQEKIRVSQYEKLGDEGNVLLAETTANAAIRRSKIDRFRFFVGAKLDEVTRMVDALTPTEATNDDFFRRAINRWWSLMEEFEMEPTKIDKALHSSLRGKWEFDNLNEENIFDDLDD